MTISVDKIKSTNINKTNNTVKNDKTEIKSAKAKHFDEIIISRDRQNIEEQKLTEKLSLLTKRSIREKSSEKKVLNLKERIEQGTYQIDIDKIAEKMLLIRGDGID